MSWGIGYDETWHRDIGYGVLAYCDHPDCTKEIDRGLAYVCGGEPYGGKHGCGLFFCYDHLFYDKRGAQLCKRCLERKEPFEPSPEHPRWLHHRATDPSWARWRAEQKAQEVDDQAAAEALRQAEAQIIEENQEALDRLAKE